MKHQSQLSREKSASPQTKYATPGQEQKKKGTGQVFVENPCGSTLKHPRFTERGSASYQCIHMDWEKASIRHEAHEEKLCYIKSPALFDEETRPKSEVKIINCKESGTQRRKTEVIMAQLFDTSKLSHERCCSLK